MKIKTSELSGVALDWAVAQVLASEGQITVDPNDYLTGLPYMTFDCRGPWMWGCGQQEIGTLNRETGKPWVFHGAGGEYKPSTDWSQGGPLIERFALELIRHSEDKWCAVKEWTIDVDCNYPLGETMLIAACRAIVAAKLGDEVDVPEGLV